MHSEKIMTCTTCYRIDWQNPFPCHDSISKRNWNEKGERGKGWLQSSRGYENIAIIREREREDEWQNKEGAHVPTK